MSKFPSLSSEAIRALRDTSFSGGEIDGIHFIRCGRKLAPGQASTLAAHIRDVTGLDQRKVTCAHNPDFAEHDYLRIATGTPLYDFICSLKS